MKPDLRVYGEVRGLAPEAWARLAPRCPFETADYRDGVLEMEHEGRWVDAEAFLEALARELSSGDEGHADVIDNEAWTITRYVWVDGKLKSQSFGIDDVLEGGQSEGNI